MTDTSLPWPTGELGVPVQRPKHFEGGSYDSMYTLCSRALDRQGPHEVAYFRDGLLSLSVGLSGVAEPGPALHPRADPLERTGRELDFIHGRLDRSLRAVSAGRLRRMMVQRDQAMVFYDLVRPGECVVAIVHGSDVALLDQTDCRAADLAGSLRDVLRPPGDGTELGSTAPSAGTSPAATPKSRGDTASYADELAECESAIRAGNLDLVARYGGRRLRYSSDLLDRSSVHHDDQGGSRRRRYADVGRLLHSMARQIQQAMSFPGRGSQAQLVADVDGAAVIYVHLHDDDFLVGVSLDPARVAVASQELRSLAQALGSS